MSKGQNKAFVTDPLAYLAKTCVSLQTSGGNMARGFDVRSTHAPAYFDLKPWDNSLKAYVSDVNQVLLEPSATDWSLGDPSIKGYYVPYIAAGEFVAGSVSAATGAAATLKPLDNIPSTPDYPFIFTGGMNGCSFLLLNGTLPGTKCALHYPNSDGYRAGYPLLNRIGKTAADVLIDIRFDKYGEDGAPNACNFFYYSSGEWVGVSQGQDQGMPDLKRGLCSMSIDRQRGVRLIGDA